MKWFWNKSPEPEAPKPEYHPLRLFNPEPECGACGWKAVTWKFLNLTKIDVHPLLSIYGRVSVLHLACERCGATFGMQLKDQKTPTPENTGGSPLGKDERRSA